MPTQKPRLSITVEPEMLELVQRLSDLGGGSVASIVRELLDAAKPVLEHLIAAAERYRELDAGKQAATLRLIEAAEARIMPEAARLQSETLDAFKAAADA